MSNYDVRSIVNKLYSTIPLVPSNGIIQNITQDIQYGLYSECGDPDKNWDKWKERCIELLKERKILGKTKISRLVKRAQYYNCYEKGQNLAFIYVNPTGSEVDSLISESKYDSVRLFLHSDGTTYAWDGDYLHDEIGRAFPEIKSPVHVEITGIKDIGVFITNEISSATQLKPYLEKLNLSTYKVSNSSSLYIDYEYYGAKSDPVYDIINDEVNCGIQDFLMEVDRPKVAKLNKK